MILVVELQFTQLQKLRILKENSYFHGIRTRASLKGVSTHEGTQIVCTVSTYQAL